MSFFDSLKKTATKLLSESDLGKQLVDLMAEAAQKVEHASVEVLGSAEVYRQKISDPTYGRLPHAIRQWLTNDQWHDFLFHVKDTIFVVTEGKLGLHPGFKAGIHEFVDQLLHGKKPQQPAAPQPSLPPKA